MAGHGDADSREGDLPEADLFRGVRPGREGYVFAQALHAIIILLDDWCSFRSGRVDTHRLPDEDGLPAISFDKLAGFFSRLWSQVYRSRTGGGVCGIDVLTTQDLSGMVTFCSPFDEIQGLHGPGIGLFDGTEAPTYILDIVYGLSADIADAYLSFDIPAGCDVHDPRTVIRSSIVPRAEVLASYTAGEKEILEELSNAIKRLTSGEIRVLGTHSHAGQTLKITRGQFGYALSRLKSCLSAMRTRRPFRRDAERARVAMEEAAAKSRTNRGPYEQAHLKMRQELRPGSLRSEFDAVQSAPGDIWGGKRLEALFERSRHVHLFSLLLCQIARASRLRMNPTGNSGEIDDCRVMLGDLSSSLLSACGIAVPVEERDVGTDEGGAISERVLSGCYDVLSWIVDPADGPSG